MNFLAIIPVASVSQAEDYGFDPQERRNSVLLFCGFNATSLKRPTVAYSVVMKSRLLLFRLVNTFM